jgi:uncharacterized protein involved in exopolysaccharide biosynthesis
MLGKRIQVEPAKKSDIIQISYDGPTPEVAQAVVARLTDFYLDRHAHLSRTPAAYPFLAEQAERLHSQLTRTEEQLSALKNETGLIAPEGQRQALVARVGRLEDELLQAAAAATAAEAEVRALRERLAGLPQTHVTSLTRGYPNQAADLMRGQFYGLRLKEFELANRHPEGHPEVRQVRQQVAAAQELLNREEREREQVTTGPNRLYEEVQLALFRQLPLLASLRARADTLRQQLDRERAALRQLDRNQLRIARLERDLDLQTAHYRKYAENREQARIDQALERERITNISVVQPATYEAQPVSPRRLLNLALGVLLAITGSLGLALLAEHLDHSLRTPEDVEANLGLPVLASIPRWSARARTFNGRG